MAKTQPKDKPITKRIRLPEDIEKWLGDPWLSGEFVRSRMSIIHEAAAITPARSNPKVSVEYYYLTHLVIHDKNPARILETLADRDPTFWKTYPKNVNKEISQKELSADVGMILRCTLKQGFAQFGKVGLRKDTKPKPKKKAKPKPKSKPENKSVQQQLAWVPRKA